MDVLFALLSIAIRIGGLLVGIGLYWHFCRIGKFWIARTFWVLLAGYALAGYGPAALAMIAWPDPAAIMVSMIAIVLIAAVLIAPLWNPLPPRTYSFDPDEPYDGKPFKVPDEV